MSSGALVVAAASKTRSNELSDAFAALQQTDKPIFGTVLTRVQSAKGNLESPAHLTPHDDEFEQPYPVSDSPAKGVDFSASARARRARRRV
ncbi:MAG: hypothetical protein R2849_05265 [Thermomicrobiales bacterium]